MSIKIRKGPFAEPFLTYFKKMKQDYSRTVTPRECVPLS